MQLNPPSLKLAQALDALHRGGVIAYPTEGAWGLGCEPSDEVAVQRLLDLKRRERDKGLILVAGNQVQFDWLLHDLPESQRHRLTLSWPGAVTWLVPHHGRVPDWIRGAHDKVALRVSAHPLVRNLCLAHGGPLVSTSANPAGSQAPVQQYQVRRYFAEHLDYILPGQVQQPHRASVIRDLESDRVIRA